MPVPKRLRRRLCQNEQQTYADLPSNLLVSEIHNVVHESMLGEQRSELRPGFNGDPLVGTTIPIVAPGFIVAIARSMKTKYLSNCLKGLW